MLFYIASPWSYFLEIQFKKIIVLHNSDCSVSALMIFGRTQVLCKGNYTHKELKHNLLNQFVELPSVLLQMQSFATYN